MKTAMTTKHTPGPWKRDGLFIERADGTEICRCCDNIDHDTLDNYEERKSNARLIAIAPELLLALKGLLACVNVRIDDPRCAAFDAARAAVAKAEGANG